MIKSVSNQIPKITDIPSIPGQNNSNADKKINFGEILSQTINSVNEMQNNSARMGELFAAGKIDDLHTVMIESEKAELALQFTLQIRNKILDAYSEIMRMQI